MSMLQPQCVSFLELQLGLADLGLGLRVNVEVSVQISYGGCYGHDRRVPYISHCGHDRRVLSAGGVNSV